MVEQELKPCPFCQAEAKWRPVEDGVFEVPFGVVTIHTDECWFNSFNAAFEDLPAVWNTRPTEAAAEARGKAEVERLRALLEDALYYVHMHEQEHDTKGRMTLATNIRAALNGGQHE